MQEYQDFYAILGVSHDATEKDIARAHAKKRRECNNEDELIVITQAYETLRDKKERDEYDLNLEYGARIDDLFEKIDESETKEDTLKFLKQLKKVYLEALTKYEGNHKALYELVELEILIGNKESAINFLLQRLNYADETEKLDIYSRLGKLSEELKKVDDAIEYYQNIQKTDVSRVEDVIQLVQLYYEKKDDLNKAIQILYDCISRAANSEQKIEYSYEILRGIRVAGNGSNSALEKSIYRKLKGFHSENEEEHFCNACKILDCMLDAVDRADFECYYKLEEIYLSFDIKIAEVQEMYKMCKQLLSIKEKGLMHEAIDLYSRRDELDENQKKEFGLLVIKQAEKIKLSLNVIKTEAPWFYKISDDCAKLDELIDEYIALSREYKAMGKDSLVNNHLREMLKYIILADFIPFEATKKDGFRERDLFFENETYEVILQSVKRLEEAYPECYKIFSDIFGGVDEIAKEYSSSTNNSLPNPNTERIRTSENNYQGNSADNNRGCGFYIFCFLVGFFGVLIIVAFPPSIFILYLVYKVFSNREEKNKNQ